MKESLPADGASRELFGLLVTFESSDDLLASARQLRAASLTGWEAYTPCPVNGLSDVMGRRGSRLPWLVFVCGLAGAVSGWWLQRWTHAVDYPLRIGGKSLSAWPAEIPVAFETCILFASLAAGLGALLAGGLPRLYHALFGHESFRGASSHRYCICVEAAKSPLDGTMTRTLLASLPGASGVEEVYHRPRGPAPGWFKIATMACVIMALVPVGWIVHARDAASSHPPIHLIHDMDDQPRVKPQSSRLAPDGRTPATRPPLGAIAREAPPPDGHFLYGIVDGQFAETFPERLTNDDVERGQSRYEIHCAACHGEYGEGNGPVARRAAELKEPDWVAPKSLLDPAIRRQPVGELFHTVTQGKATMPRFVHLLTPEDRWAVVAHVRQLQLNPAEPTAGVTSPAR